MGRWSRQVPFSSDHRAARLERWEYRGADGRARAFEVMVQAGKPLDVLGLKGVDLQEVRAYSEFVARTAAGLYRTSAPRERCPICGGGLERATVELHVFGVPYARCPECAHVIVALKPDPAAVDALFAESEKHAATYTDREALELRRQQIGRPKLAWCVEHYRRLRGRAHARVVDVGAGGGHFVAAARREGMAAEGFEKSQASRAFAQQALGVELRSDDFTAARVASVDLVTLWGVLEYVDEPRRFLAAARRAVAPDGMLVVEVPRADALGTRVQAREGAVVARHMEPTTHAHAFSDESLCTALVEEDFGPVAAWYFGMDAYEAVVQAALSRNDAAVLDAMAAFLPSLQQSADLGRQCDDLVVAALPLEK